MEYEELYEEFAKCPFCGYEDRDCFEWRGQKYNDEGTHTCGKCDKEFSWERNFSVSYNSRGIEEKKRD